MAEGGLAGSGNVLRQLQAQDVERLPSPRNDQKSAYALMDAAASSKAGQQQQHSDQDQHGSAPGQSQQSQQDQQDIPLAQLQQRRRAASVSVPAPVDDAGPSVDLTLDSPDKPAAAAAGNTPGPQQQQQQQQQQAMPPVQKPAQDVLDLSVDSGDEGPSAAGTPSRRVPASLLTGVKRLAEGHPAGLHTQQRPRPHQQQSNAPGTSMSAQQGAAGGAFAGSDGAAVNGGHGQPQQGALPVRPGGVEQLLQQLDQQRQQQQQQQYIQQQRVVTGLPHPGQPLRHGNALGSSSGNSSAGGGGRMRLGSLQSPALQSFLKQPDGLTRMLAQPSLQQQQQQQQALQQQALQQQALLQQQQQFLAQQHQHQQQQAQAQQNGAGVLPSHLPSGNWGALAGNNPALAAQLAAAQRQLEQQVQAQQLQQQLQGQQQLLLRQQAPTRHLPATLTAAPQRSPVGGMGAAGSPPGATTAHKPGAETQAALRAVMDQTMQDAGTAEMEPPDASLLVPMLQHQRLALAWMCKREQALGASSRVLGGILADDQGLGKTVSTIALILTNTPDMMEEVEADRARQRAVESVDLVASDGDSSDDSDNGILEITELSPPGAKAPAEPEVDPLLKLLQDQEELFPGDEERGGSVPLNTGSAGVAGAGPAAPGGMEYGSGANPFDGSGRAVKGEEEDLLLSERAAAGGVGGAGGSKRPSKSKAKQRAKAEEERSATLPHGGTLVVCPTSVLHQWARELREKVNPAQGVSVHVYHGKDKKVTPAQLARFTVVLTTYGTMACEAPSSQHQAVKKKPQGASSTAIVGAAGSGAGASSSSGGRGKRAGGGEFGGPLYSVCWHRVVLDEAQSIKNSRTLAAHAAWALHSRFRWCLSGTPIQNSVDDLYSYMRFLRFAPFDQPKAFKRLIKDEIAQRPELGFKKLHQMLKDILLRRTKQTTINGQTIVQLPARTQELVRVKFSAPEASYYAGVEKEAREQLQALQQQGSSAGSAYINMLYMLLRLRQACNHPWLVRGGQAAFKKGKPPSAPELAAARKLTPATRSALLAALQAHGSQCPLCADVPEDPVAAACGHVFCRQCAAAQFEGSGPGAGDADFLCTTCGQALRASDVHSGAALQAAAGDAAAAAGTSGGGASAGAASGSGGNSGSSDWTSSAKVDRLMELLGSIRERNTRKGASSSAASAAPVRSSLTSARLASAFRQLPGGPPPAVPGARPAAGSGARRPEKAIVFSQWTAMLDLLEVPLKRKKFGYRRLDGTMSVAHREKAIRDFEEQGDVVVLLTSLKAAALGVNLVAANHVMLMDPWWNPTTEDQAIDRAHRIGQTRPVHVSRIVVPGTVEDRILALQDKKRDLVSAALSVGADGALAAQRLSYDELSSLFFGQQGSAGGGA